MKTLRLKDTETGNWMIISHSENTVIVDTENDKVEIMGTFKEFGKLLNDNSKNIETELQISEESAFGEILRLITGKYENLEIIYTVKYYDNTVLDVIWDFSRNISKSTDFEIHCVEDKEWLAKVNGWFMYGTEENVIATNKLPMDRQNQMYEKFNKLREKLIKILESGENPHEKFINIKKQMIDGIKNKN